MSSIRRPKLIQNDTFLSGGVELPGIPTSEVLTLTGSAIAKNVGDADFAATYTVVDANGVTRTGMKLRSSDRKVVRVNADGTLRVMGGGSCTLELDSGAGSGTLAVTITGAAFTGEDPDNGTFLYKGFPFGTAVNTDPRDALLAALSTAGLTVVDAWFHDFGVVKDGSNNLVTWTGYKNGKVFAPVAGQTTTVVNSSIRGPAKVSLPSLDLGNGHLAVIGLRAQNGRVSIRNGVLCYDGTSGAAVGRMVTLAAPVNQNRALYNDANGSVTALNYPLAPSVGSNGEFTVNTFVIRPGGTTAMVAVGKENFFGSNMGGTAVANGDYDVTLNKENIFGGGAAYDQQDVAFVILCKAPTIDTATFGTLIDPIAKNFCGYARLGGTGSYVQQNYTETEVTALGDSIWDGDTGPGGPTTQIPTQFLAQTGRSTGVLKDRTFGGFSIGDNLAGGGDPTFQLRAADDRDLRKYLTNPQYAKHLLLYQPCTNDYASMGRSTAVVLAAASAHIDFYITSGIPAANVYAAYMLSRAGVDAQKNVHNAGLDGFVTSKGLAIFNEGPEVVADGTNANNPPFADTTHLVAAWHTIVAQRLHAVVPAYASLA